MRLNRPGVGVLLLSLGMLVLMGITSLGNWGRPSLALAREQTGRLQGVIPALDRLKLRQYSWARGGRLLEYSRGTYADPNTAWSRALGCGPLDANAERDYRALVQLLQSGGGGVVVTGITHQGRLWDFQIDRGGLVRISYVYEPGYNLPADEGRERRYQAIDGNWYLLDEDWN